MLEKIKNLFKKETEEQFLENSLDEKIENLFDSLRGDVITLCFGEDFIELKKLIMDTTWDFREELKEKTGFILPAIHILSDETLQENEIVVKVREKNVLQKFAIPNKTETEKEIKESLDFVYKNFLDEIFTYEIAEKYINTAQKTLLGTIWHVTAMYTVTEVREVLIKLLKNKKSIKNIVYVFEKFAECSLDSGFYTHNNPRKIAQELCSML